MLKSVKKFYNSVIMDKSDHLTISVFILNAVIT